MKYIKEDKIRTKNLHELKGYTVINRYAVTIKLLDVF